MYPASHLYCKLATEEIKSNCIKTHALVNLNVLQHKIDTKNETHVKLHSTCKKLNLPIHTTLGLHGTTTNNTEL